MVGSSSEDIRLSGAFEIEGASSMAVDRRMLVCPVTVQ
jgi:hypothetical protein